MALLGETVFSRFYKKEAELLISPLEKLLNVDNTKFKEPSERIFSYLESHLEDRTVRSGALYGGTDSSWESRGALAPRLEI